MEKINSFESKTIRTILNDKLGYVDKITIYHEHKDPDEELVFFANIRFSFKNNFFHYSFCYKDADELLSKTKDRMEDFKELFSNTHDGGKPGSSLRYFLRDSILSKFIVDTKYETMPNMNEVSDFIHQKFNNNNNTFFDILKIIDERNLTNQFSHDGKLNPGFLKHF